MSDFKKGFGFIKKIERKKLELHLPPEIQATNLPELGMTIPDFLQCVLDENYPSSEGLKVADNRWLLSFEGGDPKIHSEKWRINGDLFLTYGVRRTVAEEKISDANPVGHLQIVYYTFRDLTFTRDPEMINLINKIDSNFSTKTNDERTHKQPNEVLLRLMSYVSAFHDYHEGVGGDKAIKTPEFKLQELKYIYDHTCKDLIKTYNKLVDQNEALTEEQKTTLKKQNRRYVQQAFMVFCKEEKLIDKYGIMNQDIIDLFYEEGYNWSLFGRSIEEILEEAEKNNFYSQTSRLYEKMHDLSFVMAVLSSIDDSTKGLALKFQVLQNALSGNFDDMLEYQKKFLVQNNTVIRNTIEEIIRYNIEAMRNGNPTIEQVLIENGRESKMSAHKLLGLCLKIPVSDPSSNSQFN